MWPPRDALADIGVLARVQGGREKVFIHRALLDLLSSGANQPTSYGSPAGESDRASGELDEAIMNQRADVNASGAIDEQLRFAIAHKLLIEVRYGGSARVVEPHDYGLQKGTRKLLAYQLRRTGGAPRKSVGGWRLLDVAKIDGCTVLEETFRGSRGASHEHHYAWELVYARVT